MLTAIRSTAPLVAPVSLEEVRAHLRIDHTDEDPTLQLYIDAATGYLEGERGILGRVLVTQSWRQAYPLFTDPLLLPLGLQPVQSVTVIDYWDEGGVAQVVDEALYRLVQAELGPRIERTTEATWPATAVRDDAVTVEFVAGDALVAAPIRQAMLLIIGHWYANRETAAVGSMAEVPYAVTALLINHARIGFGMIAGPLDRRVTLRRATLKTNDFGEEVETWSDLATVWAARAEVSNRERFAAQQVGAELVARFRVRWSQRLHDLSPRDRIVFDGAEHNITGVAGIGRREGFEITAAYREGKA